MNHVIGFILQVSQIHHTHQQELKALFEGGDVDTILEEIERSYTDKGNLVFLCSLPNFTKLLED